MDDESSRQEPQHNSDYDGAWKEALRNHFPEFVEKYFPVEYAVIDWGHPLEWFDKELSQVLGQSGRRNQEVDVLVKVRLLTGAEQWIRLHLEIQSSHEEDFAARISLYNAGLRWVFKHRVMTLAVLADLRRGWRPEADVLQIGRFETRIKFSVCKLIEKLESDWQTDYSLPVLLARAQVEALRTASDAERRYRAKWMLVRGLYDLGYNSQQVREILALPFLGVNNGDFGSPTRKRGCPSLTHRAANAPKSGRAEIFRLVDWMMHLGIDLEERFREELSDFEEQAKMPYVTSIERFAEARGKADLCLLQLAEKCGDLPEETTKRVRNLTAEQLAQLGKALLRFESLAELENWLDEHNPAEKGGSPS